MEDQKDKIMINIAILVSLILWNVNRGNSGLAAEEWLWHGVLAQGDCSCVVKQDYRDEENVVIIG